MSELEQPDDRIQADVWSDIMCPFCYLGDALLGEAIDRFGHPVEVRHHSYQLMPDLPADTAIGLTDLLVSGRGVPRAQAEAMNAAMAGRAAEVGLEYQMDKAIAVNTRAALRLTHFAKGQGRQHELVVRLFRAYFTEGRNTGDYQVLAALAAEVGLDPAAARHVLDSGAFDDDVEADVTQARRLGITGVPFLVIDGRYGVSGAQPVDACLQALDTAWSAKASLSA